MKIKQLKLKTNHLMEMKAFYSTSSQISFYGDEYGVFVLVQEGRAWFPTEEAAISAPAEILIENDCEMELEYKWVKIKAVSKGDVCKS